MGNWHFVITYTLDYKQWLAAQGYPSPSVQNDNREPTTGDVLRALAAYPSLTVKIQSPYLEASEHDSPYYALLIEGFDWGNESALPRYFAMRGDPRWEVKLTRNLCEQCGQLVIVPDSGESSVILDTQINLEHVADVWLKALQEQDTWESVYGQLYS